MNNTWLHKAWPCGLATLACGTGLNAQDAVTPRPDLTAYPVLSITLTNVGPQTVSDALVRAHMSIKEGDDYGFPSPAGLTKGHQMVDQDVQNLQKTGYFLNVRVQETTEDSGVRLTYILQAKPKLTDIVFTGNKKYSNRRLLKAVTSKVGDPLDERKLFSDVQAIRQKYQKAGYQRTEVKYVQNVDDRTGRGSVTFEITEAPKVLIKDVTFEGATAFTQRKLRKQIKTRRHWFLSFVTGSGVLKDDQLEDDHDKLADFYRNNGYIEFEIKKVDPVYVGTRRVKLNFQVSEGQQYKVGSVAFEAGKKSEAASTNATLKVYSPTELSTGLKMDAGKTFTPKGLNKDIEHIEDKYGSKGFIDAKIAAKKTPNIENGTMDLNYRIEEGNKSYIEKVEIRGNTKTKDKVIRRELSVFPGEVFDMTEVKRSKKRLEGLNYFDEQGGVETTNEPTEVPDRRNLVVTVQEKSTGRLSLGAGFSSVDSVLGFVELYEGNADLAKAPTFKGGGQKYRLKVAFGARRRDYEISFIEPWFLDRKLRFSVDLYHRELNYVSLNDLYDERRTGARLGFERALGSENLIAGISYTIENIGIVNVDRDRASQIIKDEAGNRLVSKIGTSLVYDTRDSYLLPTKGQKSGIYGEFAGGPLGADTKFYKIEATSSWYFKGFSEGHILELMGRTGVVEGYDHQKVHIFDRWFLGGLYSLRGYRYRAVGPRDETNEPIGGNTYWFASAEYSIPIIERLRFATFYDIGMVYSNAYDWNVSQYNDNIGVGIRLNLPIGPLRLDYGIPISPTQGVNNSHGRFQFGVGYFREF